MRNLGASATAAATAALNECAMPNNTSLEEETLGPEHLELARQSRAPAISELADDAVHALLDALRGAVQSFGKVEDGVQGASVTLLRAAIRRVEAERRKRGLKARPAVPAAVAHASLAPAAKPRKPATIARKPAGRKSAEARKTDLRTEPHRLPRGKKSGPRALLPLTTDNDHLHVTRDRTMPTKDSDKAVKDAERKAAKEAAKQAEKEAAKAERQAAKEAEREARRAARKAEKQAQKDAEKAERKAERKAAAKAAKADAPEKVKASKPAKAEGAKAKAAGKAEAKPATKATGKTAAKSTAKPAAKTASKSGSAKSASAKGSKAPKSE